MRIALLFNSPPVGVSAGVPDDTFEEYDSPSTIDSISNALRKLGVDVEAVLADARLPWRLDDGHFDFVFNMAEGTGRRCREAVPAAVCELLGLGYTGSDPLTLGITLDKFIAKRVVAPDVPVPHGVVCTTTFDKQQLSSLRFPVIVKPNDEGSSKGIRDNPVCVDAHTAAARAAWLGTHYGCPVLVEEFVSGPELTVGVVGNPPDVHVLGVMEIAPQIVNRPFVYSLEVKRDWTRHVTYHVPPRVDLETANAVRKYALAAYHLLGCRDISRIDFRLDERGVPHFIECNPLPGLDPIKSDLAMLSRDHVPYDDLIQGILRHAMQRTGVSLR